MPPTHALSPSQIVGPRKFSFLREHHKFISNKKVQVSKTILINLNSSERMVFTC